MEDLFERSKLSCIVNGGLDEQVHMIWHHTGGIKMIFSTVLVQECVENNILGRRRQRFPFVSRERHRILRPRSFKVRQIPFRIARGLHSGEHTRPGCGVRRLAGRFFPRRRSQFHRNPERIKHAAEIQIMLFRKNLCGSHEGSLPARLCGLEHGVERDEGFSRADIALEQAVHAVR